MYTRYKVRMQAMLLQTNTENKLGFCPNKDLMLRRPGFTLGTPNPKHPAGGRSPSGPKSRPRAAQALESSVPRQAPHSSPEGGQRSASPFLNGSPVAAAEALQHGGAPRARRARRWAGSRTRQTAALCQSFMGNSLQERAGPSRARQPPSLAPLRAAAVPGSRSGTAGSVRAPRPPLRPPRGRLRRAAPARPSRPGTRPSRLPRPRPAAGAGPDPADGPRERSGAGAGAGAAPGRTPPPPSPGRDRRAAGPSRTHLRVGRHGAACDPGSGSGFRCGARAEPAGAGPSPWRRRCGLAWPGPARGETATHGGTGAHRGGTQRSSESAGTARSSRPSSPTGHTFPQPPVMRRPSHRCGQTRTCKIGFYFSNWTNSDTNRQTVAPVSQRDQSPCPRQTPPIPPLPPLLPEQQRQQRVQPFQLPQGRLPQKQRGLPGRPSPAKEGNCKLKRNKHFEGLNLHNHKGNACSLPEARGTYHHHV